MNENEKYVIRAKWEDGEWNWGSGLWTLLGIWCLVLVGVIPVLEAWILLGWYNGFINNKEYRKKMEVIFFLIQNFRLECLTSGFRRMYPTPSLPTCMHLQGSSKASHKHVPRAGSQEIGNGLLGNPLCHPLSSPLPPHIIYQRQSNCSKPTSFLVPKARSEYTKEGWD